ncbi:MAG: hypothetical protein ACK5XN_27145 [Bacteroidota bacterium]
MNTKQGQGGGGSAEMVEICAMPQGAGKLDKGNLLFKSEAGFITLVGPTLITAFILFLVNTIIENMGTEDGIHYWRIALAVFVVGYLYVQTRSLVQCKLYEAGIFLKHQVWKKQAFFPIEELVKAEPFRENHSSRYNRANYVDGIRLEFVKGESLSFTSAEMDNFYEFRTLILEMFEKMVKGDQR